MKNLITLLCLLCTAAIHCNSEQNASHEEIRISLEMILDYPQDHFNNEEAINNYAHAIQKYFTPEEIDTLPWNKNTEQVLKKVMERETPQQTPTQKLTSTTNNLLPKAYTLEPK